MPSSVASQDLSASSLLRCKKHGKAPRLFLVKAPADVDANTMLHGATIHLSNTSKNIAGRAQPTTGADTAQSQHGMQLRFRTTVIAGDSACAGQPICILPTGPSGDDLVAAARFHHRVTVLRSHVESSERNPSVDARQTTDAAPSAARVIPQPDGLDYKFVPFGAHRTTALGGEARASVSTGPRKKQSAKKHKNRSDSTKHDVHVDTSTPNSDHKAKKRKKAKESQDSPRSSKKKSKKDK